jgi:meso-butanediol dehydrogenase / (S,S)-butanediol dehydrogenase / diacetyl reductase
MRPRSSDFVNNWRADMDVKGKSVVITGAGAGIGQGMALGLARKGAKIIIADISLQGAEATAKQIRDEGGTATAIRTDVGERRDIYAAIELSVEKHGGLDVMINNAGFNVPEKFLSVTEEAFLSMLRVMTIGVLIGTQEAAVQMIKQGRGGKVINTASVSGRAGHQDYAPYCAAKAAAISLTQAGAKALGVHKINVNAIAPGVIATPLWDKLDRDLVRIGAASKSGEAFNAYVESVALGRHGTPSDLVGITIFLASSASDYITGQTIAVDGGMTFV